MKLLFVVPEYPPHYGGGIASFYHSLLPSLVRARHQVTVLVGSAFTSQLASYQQDGVQVKFLDTELVNSYLRKFDRYGAIPELQRHLAAAWAAWEQVQGGEGYDLVEVTDWGMLFAPWIVSPNSPPTVVQLHGSIGQIDFYDPQIDTQLQGNFIRLIEAGLLANADELQANSRANAKAWQQLTNREVNYIPPSLKVDMMRSPKNSLINLHHSLVVGRIQYWKGATTVCEALRLLGSQAPIINWIGRDMSYRRSGDLMSRYLEQQYPDIWRNKLIPLGTFAPDTTRQYQVQAKFIIVPSLWDVFNYTCIEGMAQGKVVICSEGVGAVDLITHGVNGLTFEADNPQSLAENLQLFFTLSPDQVESIGKAAQATVMQILDPSITTPTRIKSYESLVKRGKSLTKPNQWLIDAVSPRLPIDEPLAFLDHSPLRPLVKYIIQRSFKKIFKGMGIVS